MQVDSKNTEIETEDHLKLLDERELARVRKEIVQYEKVEVEIQERMSVVQQSIYKGNEKMDQFKLLMNWNQVPCSDAKVANRNRDFGWEIARPFSDARRFPSTRL